MENPIAPRGTVSIEIPLEDPLNMFENLRKNNRYDFYTM